MVRFRRKLPIGEPNKMVPRQIEGSKLDWDLLRLNSFSKFRLVIVFPEPLKTTKFFKEYKIFQR